MIIFFDGKTPIGQARIESVEGKGIIDYSVDKNYRGMNVGVSMLNMLKNLIQKLTRVGTLKAEVKSENVASIKAFEKAGFALVSNDNINGVDCRVFEYKV